MSDINKIPRLKKVMVIDDNEIDRYIAERYIKKYGFAEKVILKESAKKALEYLKENLHNPEELPNLIFLDIRMPEIDGFGFLEQYKELSDSIKSNCIIMMLTTSLNPEDHEKAKNNEYVARFLNKPLDKDKLQCILDLATAATTRH